MPTEPFTEFRRGLADGVSTPLPRRWVRNAFVTGLLLGAAAAAVALFA
jgi:hypothetical protein